jgi:hypothetical protein
MSTLLTWQEFTAGGRPQGGSIPELLLDFIENVSPIDRPALALLRKVRVSGTYVEWQEDALASRAHNAWLEGVDSTNPDLTTPSRKFTHVQNFMKFGEVSDIQRYVDHKGFNDAYMYQENKKVNELLNDIEHTLHRGSAATGATDTARQFPGLLNILTTNFTSSSGTTLTEEVFNNLLQLFYDNAVDVTPSVAFVNSWLKRTISLYSTNVTRFMPAMTPVQKLVIEEHQSDFGTVRIYLSRDQLKSASKVTSGNSIVFIDPSYFETGWLSPLTSEQLARQGSKTRFMIQANMTLIYRTEKAGGGGTDFVPYIP